MALGLCDVAIRGMEAEVSRHIQNLVELEADGSAGLLRDLVLYGEIEVVGSVEKTFEGALILGEDRGANARDVIEINAA